MCRVPRASDPFLHFLVLLVLGISHRLHKIGVAGASAAVLWRVGVGSAQTDRMFEVGVWRQNLLDHDLVFPVVAEVVMDVLWRLLGDPRQFTFIFSRETCFRSEAGASAPMSIAQYPPFGRDLSTQGQI